MTWLWNLYFTVNDCPQSSQFWVNSFVKVTPNCSIEAFPYFQLFNIKLESTIWSFIPVMNEQLKICDSGFMLQFQIANLFKEYFWNFKIENYFQNVWKNVEVKTIPWTCKRITQSQGDICLDVTQHVALLMIDISRQMTL